MTAQGNFFDMGGSGMRPPPPASTTPDVSEVRKELLALLDKARAGTVATAPWPDHEARMWRTVFPQMANWLPADEAERMRAEFRRQMQRLEDEKTLASHGYKLVTMAEFEAATDVPAGTTREVVKRVAEQWGGAFVVYDPDDDDQGWLLVGDDRAELARETVEHRCMPS